MAKTKGLYKRGRIWWIAYAGPDGKTMRESTRKTNSKDAEVLLVQRKNDVQEGKDPLAEKVLKNYTFKELSEPYLVWAERQRAFEKKKVLINQLLGTFGNIPLKQFTTRYLEEYQSRLLAAKKAAATVNRHLATIKHMFTKAVEWDMASEESLRRIRKVKQIAENNRRLRYLSKLECRALINACKPHLRPIVICALNTGMRLEEILSLKWEQVDLRHGFILLDRTKNGERREIPINQTLRDVLRGLVRHLNSPYVFTDKEGNRFLRVTTSFESAMKNAEWEKCSSCSHEREKTDTPEPGACPLCGREMKRLRGIKDFRFHDLRHTFASQLVMAGVDITTVKELLGHKTLTMTLRYAHLAPSHKVKAVEILEGEIHGRSAGKTVLHPVSQSVQ